MKKLIVMCFLVGFTLTINAKFNNIPMSTIAKIIQGLSSEEPCKVEIEIKTRKGIVFSDGNIIYLDDPDYLGAEEYWDGDDQ